MDDLSCDIRPDIEEARIVSYIETGIKREAYRLHRKNNKINNAELLILDKPLNADDSNNSELMPLDIIPSDDSIDGLIDELSFEQLLSILNTHEKIIVRLTIKNGVPQKQIADMLGMSQQTVSKYKQRAFRKLKEYILHEKETEKIIYN